MKRNPRYWKAYYTDPEQQDFDLQFSLSDRIRYYWSTPGVERRLHAAAAGLAARGIPLTLLSQYLPVQYAAIREGRLANDPRELVLDGVEQVLRQYDRLRAGTWHRGKDSMNVLGHAASRARDGRRNLDCPRDFAAAGASGRRSHSQLSTQQADAAGLPAPLLDRRPCASC